MSWMQIGGPGRNFAATRDTIYGLSPDGKGVFEYSGTAMMWSQIGGPARDIFTAGTKLYATNPDTGDVYHYNP
jgi:hypothetical protein